MKVFLPRIVFFVFVGTFILTALTCIRPPAGHFDFSLRLNEIACLRQGVNPYDVWHEDIILPPYRSNLPKKDIPPGCTEQVNAYVPWEYMLMYPFALLPRPVAWTIYSFLMGLMELLVFFVCYQIVDERICKANRLILASLPLTVVSYLLWSNASVGNFAVLVLASSALMAWSLERRHDVLAGICWAVAMVKPQSAILFAIPLLIRRKWTVGIVAAGICLVTSVFPAWFCSANFFDMLLQGPAANAELFEGCGTYPRFLLGVFTPEIGIGLGLIIGALLCLVMTWMLRNECDWLTCLMPAAVCAASWTYTQAYSHAMCWFLAFVVVRELIRNPRSRFLWVLFALCAFSLSRWFLAWHGFCAFFGWRFPMSEYAFRCIDSLNSTLSLALAVVFCLYKKTVRETAENGVCPPE